MRWRPLKDSLKANNFIRFGIIHLFCSPIYKLLEPLMPFGEGTVYAQQ